MKSLFRTSFCLIAFIFLASLTLQSVNAQYRKQPIHEVLKAANKICTYRFLDSMESNMKTRLSRIDVRYLTAALNVDAFHYNDSDTLMINMRSYVHIIGPFDLTAVSMEDTLSIEHQPIALNRLENIIKIRPTYYSTIIKKDSFKRLPKSLYRHESLYYTAIKNNDMSAFQSFFSQYGEDYVFEGRTNRVLRIELRNGSVVDASMWDFFYDETLDYFEMAQREKMHS